VDDAAPARSEALCPVTVRPFTSDGQGSKVFPLLSPQGERVAYSWTGADDDNWDVYVKALGVGATPHRLTDDPADDWVVAWSPDGRQLTFVRDWGEGAAFYTVPSAGGQARKLVDVTGLVYSPQGYFVPALSWSPNGEWVALAEKPDEATAARIVRLDLETLEKEPLTTPPDSAIGDLFPTVSPDGTWVAFARSASTAWAGLDLWLQPVDGQAARRLTHNTYSWVSAARWASDGGELVFSAEGRVLRVAAEGGIPEPVAGVGENARSPSVRGGRLVFQQRTALPDRDIWRVRATTENAVPEKLIASSRSNANASYSPDGRRVAFESDRSGVNDIWVADSDGRRPLQLTDLGAWAGSPGWSPDGREIVFDSIAEGSWNLYVVDADGGIPRQLTREPSDESAGCWSPDRRWIYFTSDRGGDWQVWRIPVEGGSWEQLTHHGGGPPQLSADGRHLYYVRNARRGAGAIWRMPADGGPETEVLAESVSMSWALGGRGLYFASSRPVVAWRRNEHRIRRLDLESGEITQILRREGPFFSLWLSESPDEEWLLYSEQPAGSAELMVVENFR
jgi:Tol biopolymer transport system component